MKDKKDELKNAADADTTSQATYANPTQAQSTPQPAGRSEEPSEEPSTDASTDASTDVNSLNESAKKSETKATETASTSKAASPSTLPPQSASQAAPEKTQADKTPPEIPSNKTEPVKASDTHTRSAKSETKQTQKKDKAPRHPLIKWIFLLVLILCTLAILAAIGWGFNYVYTHMSNKIDTLEGTVNALENNEQGSTSALNQKINALEQTHQRLQKTNSEQSTLIDTLSQRIESAEQRLASQRKRILSMSTTSRDDWLLAEAEYLIKLANQRMLVERNAQGASALLVEADTILKDMGDPDLFPVRQQLAKDITAVRLIEKIDVEGLFLTLNALTESIGQLPLNPTWQQRGQLLNTQNTEQRNTEQNADTAPQAAHTSLKDKALAQFKGFTDKLDDYIRIREHDKNESEKLLIATPERAHYVQQNLQLMLERASLALLREQQKIFDNSLVQATLWLTEHFPESSQRAAFIEQINQVKNTNVIQTLPDITQSLEALKAYINELHALKGTANQKGSN